MLNYQSKNFIKKFFEEDYNSSDIIMIYNEFGNNEINKKIFDRIESFDLNLRNEWKKDFNDNKLKLRKFKLHELINKLRKIHMSNI